VSLFITGTDTGVGKTHIAARLLHLLRASGVGCAGMKAICCGDRRDAEALLAAGSDCVTIAGWVVLITRRLRCEALPHTSSGALVLY
jgi:dethiobiotin synthetase